MNRITEILEMKNIEQTWFVEKIGKSFRHTNTDVCNCCQPGLEQLFEIAKILLIESQKLISKND